jgi:peptidoglycan/xylan/chitin deacetylase (PgdA/CDA1 family)
MFAVGLHLLIKRYYRDRVLILMYHGLVDEDKSSEWTQLPASLFEKQMKYIKENLNPIPLDNAVEYLSKGGNVPANPVVITFDDGYESDFALGLEILKKYDIPAVVFITTSFIDDDGNSENRLWFDTVTEIAAGFPSGKSDLTEWDLGVYFIESDKDRMSAASLICEKMKSLGSTTRSEVLTGIRARFGTGSRPNPSHRGARWSQVKSAFPVIRYGAHTKNHEILVNLSPQEAHDEIAGSKKIIEEKTGRPVEYFAYPNGRREDFGVEAVRIVSESGFRAALTTMEGFNHRGDDLFELKRLGIGCDTGMLWFKMAVTGTIDLFKRMRIKS